MSKVSMPRPRYVAFRIDAAKPVARRGLANALRDACKAAAWPADRPLQLTRFAWPHGIVRVEHTEAAAARGLLASVGACEGQPVAVQGLGTSGTLKALTTRLGFLQERTD